MRAFLSVLGNPQCQVPPVIHVAGTNGKGSTIAFLRSILECHGYSAHVYTSPHLVGWNERIRLSGEIVSDEELFQALEECRKREEATGITVSHFEGFTAAALLLFSRRPATVTLVEVGMGGRDDATNVFEQPICSVITPISIDHQEFLGNSLELIAAHKVGIMRAKAPCVVAPQADEVRSVIQREAQAVGAKLFAVSAADEEGVWHLSSSGDEWGVAARIRGERFQYQLPNLGLQGAHQAVNAAVAVMTCQAIAEVLPTNEEARRQGLTRVVWPGRLQRLERGSCVERFSSDWEIWCDCAHNEGGAAAIGTWLAAQDRRPLIVVAACSRNRSLQKLLDQLPLDDLVALVSFVGMIEGVALGPGDESLTLTVPVYREESIDAALWRASQVSQSAQVGRLLIFGSLHLVGSVLRGDTR